MGLSSCTGWPKNVQTQWLFIDKNGPKNGPPLASCGIWHIIFVCLIFVTLTREDEIFFGLDLITSNIKRQCLRHLFISHHRSKTMPRREKSSHNYYFTINSQYILVYLTSIIPLVKYIIPILRKWYVWMEGISVCCPSDRHVLKMVVTLTWDPMFCIIVDVSGVRTMR